MFTAVLGNLTVTDLDRAEQWYRTLFDRGPDARPMSGLLEWHLADGAAGRNGVQVWAEADRAGGSTVVLVDPELDATAARLASGGIDHSGPEQATAGRILRLQDPDGNRVVLTDL